MKKIAGLLLILMLVMTLYGCQFSEHGDIYDDESRWTQSGDTYSFLGMVETNDHISFKRFSGIFTLKRWTVDGEWIITIDQEIDQGQFKCFLVTEDDEVIELFEGENIIPAHEGRYRLRIVANDAKGSLSYTIN